MFTFFRKSLILSVCFIATSVMAQKTLEEVNVVTTKLPQKSSQLAKSMIVLGDSVIRAHAGWSVSDLLQKQVGINVVGAGQPLGSIQSLFLRGASSGKTLILLDGVPLYDPSSTEGNYDLNLINLQFIERIEILKGGQSTLYGSDAVAGVINFISKKGSKKPFTPYGKLSYGSFNTLDLGLGVNGDLAGFNYNLGFNKVKSDGFSSAVSSLATEENDGFDRTSLNAQLSKQFGEVTVRAFGRQTDYTADLDAGALVDEKDYVFNSENFQVGVGADWVKEKFQLHFNAHTSQVDRTFEDDSSFVAESAFAKYSYSTFGSKSNFYDLYAQFFVNEDIKILLGADLRNQSIAQTYYSVSAFGPFEDVPLLYDDTKIDNFSVYSAVDVSVNQKVGIELGGRLNSHSEYGTNFSYSLNPYFRANEMITVFGVLATSYKNPTLYQLYSPYGNLDLVPETSRNIELGFKYNNTEKGSSASVAYFNRRNEDKVTFLSLDTPPYGQYINIDEQQTSGIELSASQQVGPVSLHGNYTFLDGFNSLLAEEEQEYNLIRVPKNSLNLGASLSLCEKLSIGLDYQFVGERTDGFYDSNLFQTVAVDLDAYSLIDLSVSYLIKPNFKVFAAGSNIFNTDYTEVYGYNSRPANFKIGLAYN
ncbi:TonB-dependent receptor plug domain-containing protein [Arcticibacterium luteifluviistationis]|uniref:TonB-dependent receptor n=1 Tax=Arcticibacterium luteifluviistationis TaxID=1784714 RepID=A0A2Z4GAG5_9BACT|nr:TonB-dependent receptor [Arcticibacterium luteifluviistationis]AWV98121.1 hypothetical protein DJ013_08015 [Arcticibacterium luteifluviistationis]